MQAEDQSFGIRWVAVIVSPLVELLGREDVTASIASQLSHTVGAFVIIQAIVGEVF